MAYKFNALTGNFDLVDLGPGGDVVGPASSTDDAIATFDGTTGLLLQNSGITIASIQSQIDDAEDGIAANETAIEDEETRALAAEADLAADIAAIPVPLTYKGTWNAATNTPTLANTDTGKTGWLYQVSVGGTVNFGAGAITFVASDKVVNNGTIWEKWDLTDAVNSVNGEVGVVELTTLDIPEDTNLYFTDERAQDAVGTIVANTDTVNLSYSDGTPNITAAVRTQLSLTSDTSGVKLVGDASTPGNTKYYGTNSGGTKGYYSVPYVGPTGDIQETSFSLANNQSSVANVVGLAFAALVVRSFTVLASVEIDATADLYAQFTLVGINKNGSFDMSVEALGDVTGIVFSITSAGQVQYTSTDVTGFVTGIVKFRAFTTTV
jgi:hypothetical protein